MGSNRVERKLAAILAADVAGYSRLAGADEERTLARLRSLRGDLIDPAIAAHHGRVVKRTGDGILIEFRSVVDATRCALEVQNGAVERNAGLSPDRRIEFRVGIHVGDVVEETDGDLMGDAVNIAARLEGIAEVGGICLSEDAWRQVRDKMDETFVDLGAQSLKNIAHPVRAYRIGLRPTPHLSAAAAAPAANVNLTLPDKPSIAVLPFQNMSGDPEQEYFADGIAEDVLTTLSKIQELLVIERNSSFVFKGQTRDIRDIGRMLGVRYVLEGSVRKAGNRVRLTAQLIDSQTGGHVWGDRFEGDLDDVFELQDRITQDIAAALEVRLTLGEEARVWRKRAGSPLVYEHFIKGRTLYINFARHTHAQARLEAEHALAINPSYIPALGLLGMIITDQTRFEWESSDTSSYEAALEYASRGHVVDPNHYMAYVTTGYVRLFQRRHDEAVAAGEKAVALGPNCADAYHMAGMFLGYAGDFRKSARYEEQAQRLSPLSRKESMVDEARARFHLGDLNAARDIASRVLAEKPNWLTAQSTLAASLWNLGSEDEARLTVKRMLANHPNLTASRWARRLPYRHQTDLEAMLTPLRHAGLPD